MWLLRGRAPRLASPLLAAGASFATYCCKTAENDPAPNGVITRAVHEKLESLRKGEAEMRRKWEEDEIGFHKLPPRAWPPVQPKAEELNELETRAAAEGTEKLRFDLATCLTFNLIDPERGLKQYQELAAAGNLDAAVAVGTILLEGIGRDLTDEDVAEGVRLMREASERGHSQGQYEMGTLHCTLP
jgi:hypothetical protein